MWATSTPIWSGRGACASAREGCEGADPWDDMSIAEPLSSKLKATTSPLLKLNGAKGEWKLAISYKIERRILQRNGVPWLTASERESPFYLSAKGDKAYDLPLHWVGLMIPGAHNQLEGIADLCLRVDVQTNALRVACALCQPQL